MFVKTEKHRTEPRGSILCQSVVYPQEWTFLRKHREQGHSGSDLGQATREAELRRIAQVWHRVARQTVAGAAFIPAARVGEHVVRQKDQILVEGDRGDNGLDWAEVPTVAFAVLLREEQPAGANIVGLGKTVGLLKPPLHE